ncbi:hypothetical protein B0H15DRAFT_805346 [Mycena belliarum]|uniref:Restriction of telomere capping protein 4 n=1 Tax=Mycena belliarum TaxID=1033014 RepID=A0AAD6XGF7_9AGAR|nr:hypothetical protein B0H15DRAFT_805346 [Mycena belliae]
MCGQSLPVEPSAPILALFNRLQTLTEQVGPTGKGVAFLNLEICDAITHEKSRDKHLEAGEENNWPNTIDFSALPQRVLDLRSNIIALLKSPKILGTSTSWTRFCDSIRYKIFAFCKSSSKINFPGAFSVRCCGYYGPKGEFLINSTLVRLLSKNEENWSNELYATLNEIVSTDSDDFDRYDENSNLLNLKDFISFVLTPFTAALLISEDRGVSIEEADTIRDTSSKFGEVAHPENDDDTELDELHRANIRAMRAANSDNVFFTEPARYRKKSHLADSPSFRPSTSKDEQKVYAQDKSSPLKPKSSRPTPKRTGKAQNTISLDDFVEPKPKVVDSSKKRKRDAKANMSVQSSYGTRSKAKKAP